MNKIAVSWMLASLLAATAQAQPASPFHGTWAVSWEGDKQVYDARMVLDAQGGTWKTSARSKNNPCVGREVPVKVDTMTAEEAKLTLAFAEVIPGCKDSKVTLKTTAGGIAGRRGDADLTLKRE